MKKNNNRDKIKNQGWDTNTQQRQSQGRKHDNGRVHTRQNDLTGR